VDYNPSKCDRNLDSITGNPNTQVVQNILAGDDSNPCYIHNNTSRTILNPNASIWERFLFNHESTGMEIAIRQQIQNIIQILKNNYYF
jgi:hypothetical protein